MKNPLILFIIKLWKRFFIQPSCWVCIFFFNDHPDILHFDFDVDLDEWGPNVLTYISRLFHYVYTAAWERVVVEISLYSCTKFSNNWFVPVFLRGAVILIYCLRWATTQSSISLTVFSFVVLFLTTSEIFMESKLKHLIAWSLGAVVKHKNIANLCENVFRSQSVRVGFELIKVNILVKSWVVTYLGKTGLIF